MIAVLLASVLIATCGFVGFAYWLKHLLGDHSMTDDGLTVPGSSGALPRHSAPLPATPPVEVICGLAEAYCKCTLRLGHDGPHECNDVGCGGSWTFDDDGEFVSVRLPGVGPGGALTTFLFGGDEW